MLKINDKATKNGLKFEWKAKFTKVTAKEGTVSISIPSNTIIGSWNMKAVTSVISTENVGIPAEAVEYVYPVYGIHVLFNPWDQSKNKKRLSLRVSLIKLLNKVKLFGLIKLRFLKDYGRTLQNTSKRFFSVTEYNLL